jgi:hypothetical protein
MPSNKSDMCAKKCYLIGNAFRIMNRIYTTVSKDVNINFNKEFVKSIVDASHDIEFYKIQKGDISLYGPHYVHDPERLNGMCIFATFCTLRNILQKYTNIQQFGIIRIKSTNRSVMGDPKLPIIQGTDHYIAYVMYDNLHYAFDLTSRQDVKLNLECQLFVTSSEYTLLKYVISSYNAEYSDILMLNLNDIVTLYKMLYGDAGLQGGNRLINFSESFVHNIEHKISISDVNSIDDTMVFIQHGGNIKSTTQHSHIGSKQLKLYVKLNNKFYTLKQAEKELSRKKV